MIKVIECVRFCRSCRTRIDGVSDPAEGDPEDPAAVTEQGKRLTELRRHLVGADGILDGLFTASAQIMILCAAAAGTDENPMKYCIRIYGS